MKRLISSIITIAFIFIPLEISYLQGDFKFLTGLTQCGLGAAAPVYNQAKSQSDFAQSYEAHTSYKLAKGEVGKVGDNPQNLRPRAAVSDGKEGKVAAAVGGELRLTQTAAPANAGGLVTRRDFIVGGVTAGALAVSGLRETQAASKPSEQDLRITNILARMPLEQKVALLQSMGWIGTSPLTDERARQLLLQEQVGIFTLYDYNLGTAAETARMIASIYEEAKRQGKRLPIFNIDGEGGRLYTNVKGATMVAGNMALGAIYTANPKLGRRLAFEYGRLIGKELVIWGATWTLSPVTDVNSNPLNPVIGIRSIAEDANTVTNISEWIVRGLQSAGVAATVKHVPDHGDTAFDTHTELPVDLRPRSQIRGIGPVTNAIKRGVAAIMPSHVAYPNAFPDSDGPKIRVTIPDPNDPKKNIEMDVTPATMSPAILTGFFRNELGFKGVIITDALEMGAIIDNFGIGYAALLALEAGADTFISGTDPVFLNKVWQEKFGRSYTIEDQLEAYRTIVSAAREGIVTIVRKGADGKFVKEEQKISPQRQERIRQRIEESARRVLEFQTKWGLKQAPNADIARRTVGSARHKEMAREISRAALTLLKAASGQSLKNLPPDKKIVVMRPQFERLTPADSSYKIGFTLDESIRERHPNTQGVAVLRSLPAGAETAQEKENRENAERALIGQQRPKGHEVKVARGIEEASAAIEDADVVVVETYFGHKSQFQIDLLKELAGTGKRLVHLVMGNPYDAGIVWRKADIVAVGYSPHTAPEMAALLFKEIKPQGRLPVTIPGLAKIGDGLSSFADRRNISSGNSSGNVVIADAKGAKDTLRPDLMTRREFLQNAGLIIGGIVLSGADLPAAENTKKEKGISAKLEYRDKKAMLDITGFTKGNLITRWRMRQDRVWVLDGIQQQTTSEKCSLDISRFPRLVIIFENRSKFNGFFAKELTIKPGDIPFLPWWHWENSFGVGVGQGIDPVKNCAEAGILKAFQCEKGDDGALKLLVQPPKTSKPASAVGAAPAPMNLSKANGLGAAERIVERAMNMMNSGSVRRRIKGAEELRKMGKSAAPALKLLVEALHDRDSEVQHWALLALNNLHEAAIPEIDAIVGAFAESLRKRDNGRCFSLLAILDNMGPIPAGRQQEQAVKDLYLALTKYFEPTYAPDFHDRLPFHVCQTLFNMGPLGVAALYNALKSDDVFIRVSAGNVLANYESQKIGEEAIFVLKNVDVRKATQNFTTVCIIDAETFRCHIEPVDISGESASKTIDAANKIHVNVRITPKHPNIFFSEADGRKYEFNEGHVDEVEGAFRYRSIRYDDRSVEYHLYLYQVPRGHKSADGSSKTIVSDMRIDPFYIKHAISAEAETGTSVNIASDDYFINVYKELRPYPVVQVLADATGEARRSEAETGAAAGGTRAAAVPLPVPVEERQLLEHRAAHVAQPLQASVDSQQGAAAAGANGAGVTVNAAAQQQEAGTLAKKVELLTTIEDDVKHKRLKRVTVILPSGQSEIFEIPFIGDDNAEQRERLNEMTLSSVKRSLDNIPGDIVLYNRIYPMTPPSPEYYIHCVVSAAPQTVINSAAVAMQNITEGLVGAVLEKLRPLHPEDGHISEQTEWLTVAVDFSPEKEGGSTSFYKATLTLVPRIEIKVNALPGNLKTNSSLFLGDMHGIKVTLDGPKKVEAIIEGNKVTFLELPLGEYRVSLIPTIEPSDPSITPEKHMDIIIQDLLDKFRHREISSNALTEVAATSSTICALMINNVIKRFEETEWDSERMYLSSFFVRISISSPTAKKQIAAAIEKRLEKWASPDLAGQYRKILESINDTTSMINIVMTALEKGYDSDRKDLSRIFVEIARTSPTAKEQAAAAIEDRLKRYGDYILIKQLREVLRSINDLIVPAIGTDGAAAAGAQAAGRTIYVVTNEQAKNILQAELQEADVVSDKDNIVPLVVDNVSDIWPAIAKITISNEADRVILYMPNDDAEKLAETFMSAAGISGIPVKNLANDAAERLEQIKAIAAATGTSV